MAEIVTTDPAVRLRRASPADDAFVKALFDDVRAEPFLRGGLSGAVLRQVLDQQFRLQTVGHVRQFPGAAAWIIERQAAVGRLLIDCGDRRWHVIDLALVAACRGQGIGALVIEAVAAAARAQGVPRLTLTVLESNLGACRVYSRLGFVETGPASDSGYRAMARLLDA